MANLFIKKTLLYLLPIFLVGVTLEFAFRGIPNDYSLKNKYLEKNAGNVTTLILGNSHSYYGLNPVYFKDTAFNLSHISQSINYDLELLMKYEQHLLNLRKIIIPISYVSMYARIETCPEKWRVKNYSIYYNIKRNIRISDRFEITSGKLYVNIRRIFQYYINNSADVTCSVLGWGLNYTSNHSVDLEHSASEAVKRHTVNIESEKIQGQFSQNKKCLMDILEICRKREVELILFTPPAHKTYVQKLDKEQLDITFRHINEFESGYKLCHYVNLLSDTNFIEEDFFDADHLNEKGARKLSMIIQNI
jgi:hypothetical protein